VLLRLAAGWSGRLAAAQAEVLGWCCCCRCCCCYCCCCCCCCRWKPGYDSGRAYTRTAFVRRALPVCWKSRVGRVVCGKRVRRKRALPRISGMRGAAFRIVWSVRRFPEEFPAAAVAAAAAGSNLWGTSPLSQHAQTVFKKGQLDVGAHARVADSGNSITVAFLARLFCLCHRHSLVSALSSG
jgi:hypothetical protein